MVVGITALVSTTLKEATFFSTKCLSLGEVARGDRGSPGELGGKNKKEHSSHDVPVQMGMSSV